MKLLSFVKVITVSINPLPCTIANKLINTVTIPDYTCCTQQRDET